MSQRKKKRKIKDKTSVLEKKGKGLLLDIVWINHKISPYILILV